MGTGVGTAALASLLGRDLEGNESVISAAPKAKRIIYLFQSGAPSQLETLDYKPGLAKLHESELPDSIRDGQRLTGMTSGQSSFPVAASKFAFQRYGKAGTWFSDLLKHTGAVADDLCVVKSIYTEAINHDPAITFMQTGSQQPGRPSFGAWSSYGLGSDNEDLPSFVVLISKGSGLPNAQGLLSRLWGSGFIRDPAIESRIAQYEMAYKMQTSVPELTDLSKESARTMEMYGPEADIPGTFAANCLLARRLAERGVRFIQLYHRGWDQHSNLPDHITKQCLDIDQPCGALIADLKQRGLLDDTLVVWAGEFGRTVYCQGKLTRENYGRDHHPRCFSVWMAGGGVKPGLVHGETDDFSYNVTSDPVHVHDLQATILHCLGVNHERLTYRFQGRDYRLTDVHGKVVSALLS